MKCLLSLVLLLSQSLFASTAFFVEGTQSMALAKSYDWGTGHGMVIVNKRNVQKKSLLINSSDVALTWVSKYGSLTFNQFATEMPMGGINEKGLVVESTQLNETAYPTSDSRPSLNELQWIQYLLDNYESISEIEQGLNEVRLTGLFGNFHFLVCDRSSSCLVIESLLGNLVTHAAAKVVTNNNYLTSQEHLALFDGFGGSLPIPTDNSSLSRFVKINHQLSVFRGGQRNNVIETSFTMLNSVRHAFTTEGKTTVWNLIYDNEHLKVHFVHTLVGMKKFVNFADLDFSCSLPRKVYNIESHQGSSDIAGDLLDYKKSLNQRIIQLSLSDMLLELSPEQIEKLIQIPDTFSCLDE